MQSTQLSPPHPPLSLPAGQLVGTKVGAAENVGWADTVGDCCESSVGEGVGNGVFCDGVVGAGVGFK
jgi:hypothetical protein